MSDVPAGTCVAGSARSAAKRSAPPQAIATAQIAEVYIERFVMPRNDPSDAIHLALASHGRCDILLTWNCAHLANFRKLDHIRRVNALLGLQTPSVLTPLELLGESELL